MQNYVMNSLEIKHSSFMENNTSSNGGAMHAHLNTTMVTIFTAILYTTNTANGDGGALFLKNNSQGTIVVCLLQLNVANYGGALALRLSNCFVSFEREALLVSHQ